MRYEEGDLRYEEGDLIRYMTGPLGTKMNVESTKFLDSSYDVKPNDRGVYVRPLHPDEISGEEGWHITRPWKHDNPANRRAGLMVVLVHGHLIEPYYKNTQPETKETEDED